MMTILEIQQKLDTASKPCAGAIHKSTHCNVLVISFKKAYLHLVFLVIISFFLMVYLYNKSYIPQTRVTQTGLLVFGSGVYLNEMLLAMQGVAAFSYTVIPYSNTALWIIAITLWLGLWFILSSLTLGQET